MNFEANHTICLERRFTHPPERVFAAFSSAEAVSSWLSPSDDIELKVERFHFASEGEFSFLYLMPPGDAAQVAGRFLLIDPPHRLSFTWEWQPPDIHAGIESHVSVAIEPIERGSLLRLEHRRLTAADMPPRHSSGWMGALDKLSQFLNQVPEGKLS